jgi:hypothetical protein
VNPKTYRYILWPLWFVVVPAVLSALTYNLVAPSEQVMQGGSLWETIQYWVKDQPVPTLIVLFTIFEMVLYSYRHVLPGSQYLGGNERTDVPKKVRREFEHATSKRPTCWTRPSASSARTAPRSSARSPATPAASWANRSKTSATP